MWKKGHTLQVYAQKQSVNPDLHPSFLLCKIHFVVQSLINHFILTRMWLHWRYVKAWCVSSRHKGFYEIHPLVDEKFPTNQHTTLYSCNSTFYHRRFVSRLNTDAIQYEQKSLLKRHQIVRNGHNERGKPQCVLQY